MKLSITLRIGNGEIVAFVGGGGKTTAMFRLAEELVRAGKRVITTTTTRIFATQIALAPAHFALDSRSGDLSAVEAALEAHGHALVTGPVDPGAGKAFGIDPALVPQLARLPDVAAVLVEADGSRMRPFKAPAEHEPVIPTEATLVVPVVGADVFGESLAGERVHRVELVRALTGAPEGEPVTPELVARVVGHRQGGLKNVPSGARVIPLINKVETVETLAAGRETALHLLGNLAVRAVMLGAVRRAEAEPVREVHGRVAAVVLAAGRSTRMGQLKQILPWGEGSTIVAEVVRRLQASAVVEVVVVTGAGCEAVEAVLSTFTTPTAGNAAGPRVRLAFNPDFETSEMARSLQVGLSSLPEYSLAALVTLGDQPQLDPEVVQAILQRWRETQAPLVAPFFQGRRGHPLLFDRSVWPDLLTLPPEANPREILQKLAPPEPVEVISDSILRDIDTPGDYARERRIARFSG